jgi:hypothetical protein
MINDLGQKAFENPLYDGSVMDGGIDDGFAAPGVEDAPMA